MYTSNICIASAVCATLHLLSVIFYEFYYRGRRFKRFNIILLTGITSSAIDLWLFGFYPELLQIEKRVAESSLKERIAFMASNVLAVIQLSAYISYIYIRALPIIRISGKMSRLEKTMKQTIILTIFLMILSNILAFFARFLGNPSDDLLIISSLTLLAGGAFILCLDIFYLYYFRRKFMDIKQSKEMRVISTYSRNSIFLNFFIFLAFTLINALPYDDVLYPIYNVVLEIFKWLVFLVLTMMKFALDRLQEKTKSKSSLKTGG